MDKEKITIDVTYKGAITWEEQDFDSLEDWQEFKKNMLTDEAFRKKATLENIDIIQDQLEMELDRNGEFKVRITT